MLFSFYSLVIITLIYIFLIIFNLHFLNYFYSCFFQTILLQNMYQNPNNQTQTPGVKISMSTTTCTVYSGAPL